MTITEQYEYPLTIQEEDGGFIISFDDPKGRFQAADFVQRKEQIYPTARRLLNEMIDSAIRDDEDIPKARKPRKNEATISPSPHGITVLCIWQEFKKQNITKAEFAKRLNWKNMQIARLFDVHHPSKLPQLEKAVTALGKNLVINLEDMPNKRLTSQ